MYSSFDAEIVYGVCFCGFGPGCEVQTDNKELTLFFGAGLNLFVDFMFLVCWSKVAEELSFAAICEGKPEVVNGRGGALVVGIILVVFQHVETSI